MSRYMQSEIDRLTAQVAVLEAKLARAEGQVRAMREDASRALGNAMRERDEAWLDAGTARAEERARIVKALREAAHGGNQILTAHSVLDSLNVPRTADDGVSYTIAARIALLREAAPERDEAWLDAGTARAEERARIVKALREAAHGGNRGQPGSFWVGWRAAARAIEEGWAEKPETDT